MKTKKADFLTFEQCRRLGAGEAYESVFVSPPSDVDSTTDHTPQIFLGGETSDWRDQIIDDFAADIDLINPIKEDYDPAEDIYNEIGDMLESDAVVFYEGGPQTEKEKELLDRLDVAYAEFDDVAELEEYLDYVVDEETKEPVKATIKTAKYDNGCIMVPVPHELASDIVKDVASQIPVDDLNTDQNETLNGIETDTHITLLYGCEPNPENIAVINDYFQDPITVKISGEVDYFDNDDASVAILPVQSPELQALHDVLRSELPNKQREGAYKPHITICYCKPGAHPLQGKVIRPWEWTIQRLDFGGNGGDVVEVYTPNAEPEAQAIEVLSSVFAKTADADTVKEYVEAKLYDNKTKAEYIRKVGFTSPVGDVSEKEFTKILIESSKRDNFNHHVESIVDRESWDEYEDLETAAEMDDVVNDLFRYVFDEYFERFEFPYDLVDASEFEIWRAINVEDVNQFVESVKGGQYGNGKYKGLGPYWSWDEDKAEAHWGGGGQTIVLHGRVSRDAVDWSTTIAAAFQNDDEYELNIREGAPIQLIDIAADGETIPIDIQTLAAKTATGPYADALPVEIFTNNRDKFFGNLGDNEDYWDAANVYQPQRPDASDRQRVKDMLNLEGEQMSSPEISFNDSISDKSEEAADSGKVPLSNEIPGKDYDDYITKTIGAI